MMRTDFTSNALADTHTFHFGVFLSSSHAPIVVLTKEKEKFNVFFVFFSFVSIILIPAPTTNFPDN